MQKNLLYSFLILSVVVLAACSQKLTDPHYTGKTGVDYVIKNTSETEWHLWWQEEMTVLRDHSDGYVLSPIVPDSQSSLSYYSDPEKARHIGNADGATLTVLEFYEFGMQNPTKRAKGVIQMPNNETYNCEIMWHDFIDSRLYLKGD